MRDGDSVVTAKRRGGTVKMDIRDLDDGDTIEVVMPWAMAECLLGRDVTLDESARKITIKIRGADGGSFEFKVK